jgi:hypothetical protein
VEIEVAGDSLEASGTITDKFSVAAALLNARDCLYFLAFHKR